MKQPHHLTATGALALLLLVAGASVASGQATVSTDRLDYPPGDTVIVTGSEWSPGEAVTLTFTADPPKPDPLVYSTIADEAGNIMHRELVMQIDDAGVAFTLVATGQTSGASAQTTFRDASLAWVSVSGQSPIPVIAGSAATYTVTVQRVSSMWGCWGAQTVGLSVRSGLPVGAHAQFSPSSLTFGWGQCTATATLTITTTPCHTPDGSSSFTVRASANSSDYVQSYGSLKVMGSDTQAPVPDIAYLPSLQDSCSVCAQVAPTATDNCDGRIIGVPSGVTCNYHTGQSQIRWTYTDQAGNMTEQYQALYVIVPTYVSDAPASLTYQTAPTATTCSVTVPTSDYGYFRARNVCESIDLRPENVPSGSVFPVGRTRLRLHGYSYHYGINVDRDLDIIVEDRTPPRMPALPRETIHSTGQNATACDVSVQISSPGATDNCGLANVSLIGGYPPSGRFPVGTTVLTFRAYDGSGNTSTGEWRVTVKDDTPPQIAAPPPITLGTGPGATACGVVLDEGALGVPTVTDNCPGVTWVRLGIPPGGQLPPGTTAIDYVATDASGNTMSASQLVTVIDDTPPVLTCPADVFQVTDPGACVATVTYEPTVVDNCIAATVECMPPSGSQFPLGATTVFVSGLDAAGNNSSASFTVTVDNPAPVAAITGPASGVVHPVGTPVSFSGAFTDNPGDTHTAQWMIDDVPVAGIVDEDAGTVGLTHSFMAAGVYLISLTVSDPCGGRGTANTVDGLEAMIVIYDPSAGFVTGGGWIDSPSGAYAADPTLVGKANFGFVSRYQKGRATPSGETEFQFKVADLSFHSSNYDWLVISGSRAQYKGQGTIKGAGDYAFMLTATDGALQPEGHADRFRIKITDRLTGDLVYDNQMGALDDVAPATALGGGSVVIHSVRGGGQSALPLAMPDDLEASLPTAYALFPSGPNPFRASTSIRFDLPVAGRVSLVVYSVAGRVVRTLANEDRAPGRHKVVWSGDGDDGVRIAPGVYFYRITVQPTHGGESFSSTRRTVFMR